MKQKAVKARGSRPRRPLLLKDEERFRLLYGPYEPPLIKRGLVVDAVRGTLRFDTFTNALIPWPKFKKRGKAGRGGIVLCGDLIRALAKESAPAISHYWGVSRATVGNWRRALELRGLTAGAQRLVRLGVELAGLPESRKKIAEAARGRVLPPAQKRKMFAGIARGWRERFAARRAEYRRTGRFGKATKLDPWIPEEEALLGRQPTAELARVLGRTPKSIQVRRVSLGIRLRPVIQQRPWSERERKLLGTLGDKDLARRFGRSIQSVSHQRQRLGIKPANSHAWTKEEESVIGKVSDVEAARRLGRTPKAIQHRRIKLGMGYFRVENRRRWTGSEEALLGTELDAVIARRLGRTVQSVAIRRRKKGFAAKTETRPWAPEEVAVLGTMSDREAARKLNRSVLAVGTKRSKSGIPAGRNRRWLPSAVQDASAGAGARRAGSFWG